jgi:hypothetical protein
MERDKTVIALAPGWGLDLRQRERVGETNALSCQLLNPQSPVCRYFILGNRIKGVDFQFL